MNGVRFAGFTYDAPAMMNTTSTTDLTSTSTVLMSADSLMPITRSAATSRTMNAAGRLAGAAASPGGTVTPRSRMRLTKYPDQPTATVDTLSAYSRIRSQPMIQANSSPAVPYPAVYPPPATRPLDAN